MTAKYTLTEEEYLACIKVSEIIKKAGTKEIVESVLLGLVMIYQFYVIFSGQANGLSYLVILLSIILIAMLWLLPPYAMKKRARELAQGKGLEVNVTETEIEVTEDGGIWAIALENPPVVRKVNEDIYLVSTAKRHLPLKLSAFSEEDRPVMQELLGLEMEDE